MADDPNPPSGTEIPPDTTPSIDVHEATARLDALAEAEEGDQPAAGPEPKSAPQGDEPPPDRPEEDRPAEEPEGEEEPAQAASDAPDYWTEEDKAAWAQIPDHLKPLIQKYEHHRTAYAQRKAAEAAEVRQKAQAEVKQYSEVVEKAAQWWQQAGPALMQAFGDKWSKVDWNSLARDNPGEWARLRQEAESEQALLAEAQRRGQADQDMAMRQQQAHIQEIKRAEHAKLEQAMPEWFGPKRAANTYKELGEWLMSKGIDAQRINGIHEAPIIEIALKAMRFERAQKQASNVVNPKPALVRDETTGRFTPQQAPTRVAPGPGQRPGNRNSEALRQARERVDATGGNDMRAVAELIRLNGL